MSAAPRAAAAASLGCSAPPILPGARITTRSAGFSARAASTIAARTLRPGGSVATAGSVRITMAYPSPAGSSPASPPCHQSPPTRALTSARRAAAPCASSSGLSHPRSARTWPGVTISAGEPGPEISSANALRPGGVARPRGGARNSPSPSSTNGTPAAPARARSRAVLRGPAQAAVAGAPAAASSGNITVAAPPAGGRDTVADLPSHPMGGGYRRLACCPRKSPLRATDRGPT